VTREEKKELALKLLGVIVAVGFVSVAIVAPGIVTLAKPFRGKRYISKQQFSHAFRYSRQRGWLSIQQTKQGERLILTENGTRRVVRTEFGPDAIKRPKEWDGKWRVVIFDVPNKKKLAREVIRKTLRTMGFRQLQESVWVHPYPCEKVVHNLTALYEAGPFVRVLLVQRFDGEIEFMRKFNLENRHELSSSLKTGRRSIV
jgi:DNA-binding transcriptional regulator PaaX